MDRRFEKLINLFLMAVAVFFAPVWIPVVFIFVVPTVIAITTILTTILLVCLPFVTVLFGMIGIPLLFGTAVMAVFYILKKGYEKMPCKIQQKREGFILKWQNWTRKRLSTLPFVKELVNSASNEDNEESSLSDSEKPLYEDESDVETVVETVAVHTEPPVSKMMIIYIGVRGKAGGVELEGGGYSPPIGCKD